MGLLRTPPQRAGQTAPQSSARPDAIPSTSSQPVEAASPTHTVANTTLSTLPSPSRAFAPRRPGVMRSPLAGSSEDAGTSSPSVYPTLPPSAGEATRVNDEEVSMDVDEPSLDFIGTPLRDPTLSFPPVTPAHISLRSIPPSAATAVATPGLSASEVDQAAPRSDSTQAGPSSTVVLAATPSQDPVADDETEEEADEDDDDISLSDIPAAPVTPGPTRARKTSLARGSSLHLPDTAQSQASSSAFITPKADRTKPTRSTRQSAAAREPAAPEADMPVERAEAGNVDSGVEVQEYGRRWKLTKDTIQLASDRVISKWTLRDLRKALPTLAARDGKEFEKHYEHAADQLRAGIIREADKILGHYKVDRSLQLMDQVVSEGEAYESQRKSDAGRIDAWRPDLTPAALTAATVLPIYDEAWERLREEYIELYDDARKRYASISAKQAQLKELEESVAEGVIELDQTIKVLDGFPNGDMMEWMEDVAGRLAGSRDP